MMMPHASKPGSKKYDNVCYYRFDTIGADEKAELMAEIRYLFFCGREDTSVVT